MRRTIYLLVIVLMIIGCKEKYNPGIVYPNTGYLVVEGFINSGPGTTTIRLSRTVKLTDAVSVKTETGATVRVEGDDNSTYPLVPQSAGVYTAGTLPLSDARKYRLYIKTSNGKEYRSDFMSVIRTPKIDSISWTRETDGVDIHINTHDPKNKTWNYTWNYEETWEFRAAYAPVLKYRLDGSGVAVAVDYIFPNGAQDLSGYRCWQYENSVNILTGSSKKLSKDEIHLPLIHIPEASWKLSELYSVKMYQHGVSEQGFDFLQRMKKNTQQVGSIFDAQPSELNSNIHNIADPLEQVIGFIDVADAQELRVFIDARDVPQWRYRLDCETYEVTNVVDSIKKYSYLSPVNPTVYQGPGFIAFLAATPICVDCRLRGSNVKPSYWPR